MEQKLSDSDIELNKANEVSWIERVFQKHECTTFIPSSKDTNRCGCGRLKVRHDFEIPSQDLELRTLKWSPSLHTDCDATNAYGTIEFQGGSHPTKAQFVRLSYTTSPDQVQTLLQQQWKLELPKLLISVHGGIANFDLQPKLKRVFKKGLLKAAKTTGAWIVSAGINTGVVRHVGEALGDTLVQAKTNIVTLGIAPWGVVQNRMDLIGRDEVTPYHAIAAPKSNSVVLNSNHSYFLLVDDGTVGKYGCEFILRKKLEKYIQHQKITTRSGTKNHCTPVVSVVLEGGTNTIRTVLECITDTPPVPVVVCDGSGRAADLLAFTHKYAQEDGTMPETMRDQLLLTVEKTFQYTREQAEKLFIELMLCVKKKELITVFRMGEGSQDIDLEILTALLKAQNATCVGQLSLALAWDRVDIARSHIFLYGQEWPEGALDLAMMESLVNDRVDFVKLLLENGVSMLKWLTFARLEELFNIKQDPGCTLRYLVRANKKIMRPGYRYSMYDIGVVIEELMGGAYKSSFSKKQFKRMQVNVIVQKSTTGTVSQAEKTTSQGSSIRVSDYPFHELMVWAVLMKRQKMAKFMWQRGEEALAKALVAYKLYKSMAHEAAQDDLEGDISEEFQKYAKEFAGLALELLEQCYKNDDDTTELLLTYELEHWSHQTCLSLAVSANHKELIAHTSCQLLLTEMWMAGLRMRKYTTLKVILGILFFPSIVWLEFKTKEELQLMPQTMEEHLQDIESDSDSDSDSDDSITISQEQSSYHRPSKGELPVSNGTALINDLSVVLREKSKKSSLRLGKKIYEFYTAPITKFWLHAFGYILFLTLMTYMVLVRMYTLPMWQEWFVIAYLFTFTVEKLRELFVSEPKKLSQKLYMFYSEVWNISDTVAIVLFTIGVILRFMPSQLLIGKACYCVDIIFWYIRLLDIFSVSRSLGPYVTMIGKMMKDLMNFVVILLIVLMAFGIVRQSITFPNEEPRWDLAKYIFLKPYFMLYGEVYAPEIDPECSDVDPLNEYKCVPGRWLVPAVMTGYLIVANILLLNLLIAVFNNTFQQINKISLQIWKFQRYFLVIGYENKPILPPPFIILCHAYLFIRFIVRRCRGKKFHFDNSLKVFLDDDDKEKIHDFEEDAMADLFRCRDNVTNNSLEERVKLTTERVENMSLRMDDINQKENSIRLSLQTVDYRLMKLEEMTMQNIDTLNNIYYLLSDKQPPHITTSQHVPLPVATGHAPPRTSASSSDSPLHSPDTKIPQISKLDLPWPRKKKSRNEERLRPFTDYSKPYGRPQYSKSVSWEMPAWAAQEPLQKELENIYRTYKINSHLGPPTPNYSAMLTMAPDTLFKTKHPKLKTNKTKHDASNQLVPGKSKPSKHQTDAVMSKSQKPPVEFKISKHMENIPEIVESTEDVFADKKECNSLDRRDRDKNHEFSPLFHPKVSFSMGEGDDKNCEKHSIITDEKTKTPHTKRGEQSADNLKLIPSKKRSNDCKSMHRNSVPDEVPGRFYLQGSSIVTSARCEYTSITDDIDTTCVNYISPPGSPMPFHQPNNILVPPVKATDVAKALNRLVSQNEIIQNEAEHLKNAEEAEHAQMELLIMKRMRHISLTDTDSLGDIAKHVMNELEMSESSSNQSVYSDNAASELYQSSSDDGNEKSFSKTKRKLKHVKSAPSFKALQTLEAKNMEREKNSLTNCKSAHLRLRMPPAAQENDEVKSDDEVVVLISKSTKSDPYCGSTSLV